MPADPIPGPPAWFEFNGHRFHRNARHRYYYDPTGHLLHHAVWAAANGPLPSEHQIHHRNHDRTDNTLENLELLSDVDHRELHAAERRSPELPSKPCEHCGEPFVPRADHILCCSPKCAAKLSVRTRREHGNTYAGYRQVACKQCGTTFRTKAGNATCCSDECREERRRARNAGDASYDPGRYRQPRTKKCPVCSQEFQADKDSIVTCGDACRKIRNVESSTDLWKHKRESVWTCQQCGDQFLSRATTVRYCTKLCRARARRARTRAELGL